MLKKRKKEGTKITKRKRKSASHPHSDNQRKKSNHPQTNSQVIMVNHTRCSDAYTTKNHDSKVSLSPQAKACIALDARYLRYKKMRLRIGMQIEGSKSLMRWTLTRFR
jgi:hypothetical protein